MRRFLLRGAGGHTTDPDDRVQHSHDKEQYRRSADGDVGRYGEWRYPGAPPRVPGDGCGEHDAGRTERCTAPCGRSHCFTVHARTYATKPVSTVFCPVTSKR